MLPEIWSVTRYNFWSFWAIFWPFTPLLTLKINIRKKCKKTKQNKKKLEILSLYTCVPWVKIIWCMVPKIQGATDSVCCHFGPFFHFDPPSNTKIKILEKCEKQLEIFSLYTCVTQTAIWCMVPEISATDRIFWHFGLTFALLPP